MGVAIFPYFFEARQKWIYGNHIASVSLRSVHYNNLPMLNPENILPLCLSLPSHTLIVLLEKQNLILKKHLHAPDYLLFHSPAYRAIHKVGAAVTPRKQTGLWLEEPDRSWLAPTNPLSEPELNINNTNTTVSPPPQPLLLPLCHQTPSSPRRLLLPSLQRVLLHF